MIKVNVIKFDVDWIEIKNLCRKTINMGDSLQEPTSNWKRKLLIAEHSPLRHSLITIEINDVPFYVMGHLVRHHVSVTPYVTTSREDRTNIPRDERKQTDLVSMRMDLNIQSLINISRKRLCNQADKTTQIVWLEVIKEIAKYDVDVAWACVSECIRDCGCPEKFGTCQYFDNFSKDLSKEELINIEARYDVYARKRKLETIKKFQ